MHNKYRTYQGTCHCAGVQFEVDAQADEMLVYNCNCSICRMSGYLHLEVPKSRFRLLSGEDMLTAYTFNTGVAKHLFCKRCGVKSFYIPRSYPEGYSVNVNCLDQEQFGKLKIEVFDGQNWERAREETHKPPEEG